MSTNFPCILCRKMVVYVLVFAYDGLVLNILNEYGIVCHYIQDPYSEGDAPAMN